MKEKLKKIINQNKGFTLLFAVLITSLLLSLSISLLNINYKEYSLSGYGRESQYAFYAADTGGACALYWDIKANSFATSSTPSQIMCSNMNVQNDSGVDTLVGGGGDSTITLKDGSSVVGNEYIFNYKILPEGYYVVVKVQKYYDKSLNPWVLRTHIESRGYNVTPTAANNKRVERGLEINLGG
ncbi:MAG: hypothetical protein WCW87_00005 [Candidatus Paceibacterota bacterium]